MRFAGRLLWEGWLHEHTALDLNHLHMPAEELEHVTTAELRKRLAGKSVSPRYLAFFMSGKTSSIADSAVG